MQFLYVSILYVLNFCKVWKVICVLFGVYFWVLTFLKVDLACGGVLVWALSGCDLEIITFLDVEFVCCGCDVLDCDFLEEVFMSLLDFEAFLKKLMFVYYLSKFEIGWVLFKLIVIDFY